MTKKADVVIVGAGVIGVAIARHLSIVYPYKKIIVFEKLSYPGLETSKFNSGVLHAGLHHPPNSFRARLAYKGSALATLYAEEHDISLLKCGMIIAVPWASSLRDTFSLFYEWQNARQLMASARAQKIAFSFLTPRGIKKLEPRACALGGIFIPSVSVIHSGEFVYALARDAKKNGVEIVCNQEVISIAKQKGAYVLQTRGDEFEAGCLINAAGLYADDIARMADAHDDPATYRYRIEPWRGEYYEIIGARRESVKRLLYPVVAHHSPGKGIHFSPRPDGSLFLGPNARSVPAKNYYNQDKTPVEVFLREAQKFCPELTVNDLRWAYAGIRPKLVHAGAEEADFVIARDNDSPAHINLIGIESPGLSASMAIAEYVGDLLHNWLLH